MSQALRTRLFEELDSLVLDRSAFAHQPARAGVENAGRHSRLSLLHRAGPLGRVAEGADRRTGARAEGKSRPAGRGLGPDRKHDPVQLADRDVPRVLRLRRRALTPSNWEALYDSAAAKHAAARLGRAGARASKLEAVFLTNDFDDPLAGFDTNALHPLPAHRRPGVSSGQARSPRSGWRKPPACSVGNAAELEQAIGRLFEHFTSHGARACAISLPPDFAPSAVEPAAAEAALQAVLSRGADGADRAAPRAVELRLLDAGRVLRRVSACRSI